nr:alpha-2-macroglobulin family protein [Rhodovulum robiginosum]
MLSLVAIAGAGQAQQGPVPDRRIAISPDVDFPGGDIRTIFDSTLNACQRACLSDPRCRAFTFNIRSNACFPKTGVDGTAPYQGALSARVLDTDSAVLARAAERAADLGFLADSDLAQARDLAEGLGLRHYARDGNEAELAEAARRARAAGNLEGALGLTGAALTLGDAADLWVDYAALLLARQADTRRARRIADARALAAAANGYLRGAGGPVRANALTVMARALDRLDRGRDMIPALRLAQALAPRDDTQRMLDDAVAKYGFRIVEHEVESDAASPRLCAVFSEPLAPAGVDYAPFVQVPEPGLAVTADGRQLCVEGVAHGARYRLTFREGLPAQSGESLAKPVTLDLYVRDRSPAVRFPGRAYVLPSAGPAALPVVTVNAERLTLSLRRVSERNLIRAIQDDFFGRPLSPWQDDRFTGQLAEELWTGEAEVGMALNRDVTTRLPLADALKGQPPGIYALQAAIPGADPYQAPAATQWFVLSDLGLATMQGVDGLHVFVRSLASAGAKAGVTVTLLSQANAVLGTAATDANGYVRFAPGLTRGTGGAAPALVTVQDGAADIAFLSLSGPEFDLSDRGVEGREPAPPIDAFLTTDRGAYRAGEVVHATALMRDGRAEAVAGVPLTAILTRPDGVEYSRAVSTDDIAGGHVFALPIAGSAPRGTWRLAVHADPEAPALAAETFLVEDFLPERIDFDLSLPEGPLPAAGGTTLSIDARYLFGAPAGDLPIEGTVRLRAADGLADWPGYRFGPHDAPFSQRLSVLPEGRTNGDGTARLALSLPEAEALGRPLEADITVRLSEGSGRPVERQITRAVSASGPMIGIKPRFDGVLPEGAEAGFDVIGLGPDGTLRALPVRWALSRVNTRYQWYQTDGRWRWEPITTRTRIANGEAVLAGGRLSLDLPVGWGRYELSVEHRGRPFAASSVGFRAGWFAAADASETPDMLEVGLDRAAYAPGDTARLRLVPRAAGKALITVMSNRLIDMRMVELAEGEATVELPVTDEWGAGAYVAATLIRPMAGAEGQAPTRALGLAHASVDPGPHRLSAAFDMPAEAGPRAPLDVALKVEGIAPGETAHASIAAVDLGILNLTGFASPDPDGHYFGQRKLGMGLRDVYGRLIDAATGAMGVVRSGGDGAAQMRMQAPPPTEELLALFEGPVTVGPDGYARTRLDLPAFNGTVRLMAVVWSPTGVGQAEADILVRDPVVVTASLPRFLAPGDQSRLRLEIAHAKGPAGRMGLDVSAEGVVLDADAIPPGLTLADKGKAALTIPITAGGPGLHEIRVALTTPDGKHLVKSLALPVQVNDPEIARVSRLTLAVGDSLTLDDQLFAEFLPGTGAATLAIGPLARLNAAGLMRQLDRYPYGCTEQITSAALPLLYLDEVAAALGLGDRDDTRASIADAVTAVLTRQSANGAFGLWAASSGDFWLDAYVTDFLSRARGQGIEVPAPAFRSALDNLRNRISYAPDFDEGGEDIAYALMVLAREGAAAMGDLRYYADVKGDAFATPLAAGQLGAALAAYGEQRRADAMFARAAALLARAQAPARPVWRADYGTPLRDAAGLLTLVAEAGSQAVDRAALADRLAAPGPRSTQEAMWTLLAAHALIDRPGAQGFTLNGAALSGPLVRALTAGDAPATLVNGTDRAAQLTLNRTGVPAVADPAGGTGYAIARRYYTLEGRPADPGTVAAGTRLVAVIEVTPFGPSEARLIVTDPLPAGVEIDNPNLLRGGDLNALDWLDLTGTAEHAEFRQDRFVAAVDWRSDDAFRLGYILRATIPGHYRHPAASVEDMYRPAYRAWTGTGQVRVTE